MDQDTKFIIKLSLVLILGLFAIIFAFKSFTIVGTGHVGVVTRFGSVQDQSLTEGFHLKNPLNSVRDIDTRTQKIETRADAASKDLQTVTADIALNYKVNALLAKDLYQKTSGKFEETLIAPSIQEAVKAATAQFTADELITKRAEVKETMTTILKQKQNMQYFIVDDVSIVNFAFSESFNSAIENKVKAEQDALASKNRLEQTKYEAEQKIVASKAEAEAIRIQAQAITQQGGKDYVSLKAIEKWNGVLPSYVLGEGQLPILNIK